MEQNAILEKVQKLVEFQKGAEAINSLAEAANAAEKVQVLLIKHNLELSDLDRLEEKHKVTRHDQEDIGPKKNEGQWIFKLYGALAKHNLCKLVVVSTFRGKYVSLIGAKENVSVVRYLGEQLEIRIRVMEKESWNTNRHGTYEKRGAYRRGYLQGAARGINVQLQEQAELQKQTNEQISALVVFNDKALMDASQREFGRLRIGRSSRLRGHDGNMNGFNDGKNMDINQERRLT